MERPTFTRQEDDGVMSEKRVLSTTLEHLYDDSADSTKGSSSGFSKEGISREDSDLDLPAYDAGEQDMRVGKVLETAEDIVTSVIHVDDDPTLNPWTFRMFFIGIGLSVFGSVLQEIFYFKPQVIYVSVMFLTVLAYALGEAMAAFIPRIGAVGRFLNPGPFNSKEHAAAVIMASAASVSALSTEALAVQKLFYGGYPNQAAGVFITLSSQFIGYGIAGLLRETLIWPTKMFYPANLPITTVFETLHRDKKETKSKLKIFWIVFICLLVWEIVPEYMFPLLIGVSVFCIAKQDSLVFTNIFGGANGNEGMGFLSISLDWNYIAGFGSPLWLPLNTLTNSCIGYLGGICLSLALYYSNVWRSQDFPFMSQLLFDTTSNSTNFVQYNTSAIFTDDFVIDQDALDQAGIPYLTGTYIAYLITSNAGLTALFVHMFLWNYNDIKLGWAFLSKENIMKLTKPSTYLFWRNRAERSAAQREAVLANPTIDPHYKLMIDYQEVPNWWYLIIFSASFITGLVCLYVIRSTLPWWGLIVSLMLATVFMLFCGAQYAITGFGFNLQPVCQMLAGYMFPGRPLANMYFTTYAYNSVGQGFLLLRDLKLALLTKLSPRATFTVQVIGCVIGACMNYVMMLTIVENQADVLVSIEGTSIWSGANIQFFNSLAIAWSIAPKMFSAGTRYEWVTLSFLVGFVIPLPFYIMHRFFPHQKIWSYLNLSIIMWYLGYLFVGINSSILSYYIIGAFGQFYLRRYKPAFFAKWNYLISAAMDGGTQVILFILTFAVAGGSGVARPFPTWWGNNGGNVDYCMVNPASG